MTDYRITGLCLRPSNAKLAFWNLFIDLLSRKRYDRKSAYLVLAGMRGKKWDGGEEDNEANLYDQGLQGEILAVDCGEKRGFFSADNYML